MVEKQIICYYSSSTDKVINIQGVRTQSSAKPLFDSPDLTNIIGFTSAEGRFDSIEKLIYAPYQCAFYINGLVFFCSYIKVDDNPIITNTLYNNVGKGEYVVPATIKREILPPSSPILQVRKVTITYDEIE